MILVTGATGNVGRAVTPALIMAALTALAIASLIPTRKPVQAGKAEPARTVDTRVS
jgi:uncharacterized protein YbjT (DUF2867 family)